MLLKWDTTVAHLRSELQYVFAEVSPLMSDDEMEDSPAVGVKHEQQTASLMEWEVQQVGDEDMIVLD